MNTQIPLLGGVIVDDTFTIFLFILVSAWVTIVHAKAHGVINKMAILRAVAVTAFAFRSVPLIGDKMLPMPCWFANGHGG